MRWVVRIELEDGDGEFSANADVIGIERSQLVGTAGLGLTLEDGKRIMALLQKGVVTDQRCEYCRSSRRCFVRAGLRAIKDHRQGGIDTVFGRLDVVAPRYERCRCGADRQAVSPVSTLVLGRTLPE
jgi:hypothetical protein